LFPLYILSAHAERSLRAPKEQAMSGEPDNLVLIMLRRIDAKVDRMAEDLGDVKHRLTTLELAVGTFAATETNHYASLALRMDRTEARLNRIERRLDIAEATPHI
jgi:hypothetical protein